MAAQPIAEGTIAEAEDGSGKRITYRNGKWMQLNPVANAKAPGAGYMGADGMPKLAPQDMNALAKYRAAADAGQGLRADANRFSALNQNVGTGMGFSIPGVAAVRGVFDPRVPEMKAISARITPQMRQAGSGTMSDRDLELYKAATVGLDKPGDTNVAIAKVIDAGTRRAQDQSAFMDEWAKRNGSLGGAQEAWSSYSEANPLFDAGPKGTTVRKVEPWRAWFGLASPTAAKPTTTRPPLADIFK